MPKYKIRIAYDGTGFGGWQSQSNSLCIQDILEQALSTILRIKTSITGSGRTDAGVHASGQIAHFTAVTPIPIDRVLHSLNGMIPKEIRVLEMSLVPESFHARFSATGKIYHYHLHLDPITDPFRLKYAFHVRHRVDLPLMKKGANYFIGTHDFTSFANQKGKEAADKDRVRTIARLNIIAEEGGIRLEFEGSGFLYKMVRNITGTLLEVAGGRRTPEEIPLILAAKNRKMAGKAADSHGLFLMQVHYPVDRRSLNEGNTGALALLSCC